MGDERAQRVLRDQLDARAAGGALFLGQAGPGLAEQGDLALVRSPRARSKDTSSTAPTRDPSGRL
ncbi:hypothetical protein [Rhodobacter sp. SGA-6-6]|uniref:hypothetical protein n=1 Tax=Rhodobacter sp. SGA-6-6 TaxID=2710882 RepID=UPI00197CF1E1|nr:hypothetical protein [Rhodobacter sp. SGA-6-6]